MRYLIATPLLAGVRRRFSGSPLARRFAGGALWSLAGAGVSRLMGVVTWVVLARLLGQAGFGELGIIQSTLGVFTALAGFGFGTTATKYVAEFRSTDPARAGRILGLSGLFVIGTGAACSLALLVLAPVLARDTLGAPELTDLLRLGGLLILISAVNGAQSGALSGFEAFRSIAQANAATAFVTLPAAALGAWHWGVMGALAGLILGNAANLVLMRLALRRECRRNQIEITYRGCLAEWSVLHRFTLPAVVSAMLAGPVNWICNAMIMRGGGGAPEMGVVTAVNQWYYALLFVPGILVGNTLPIMAERLAGRDIPSCRKLIKYAVRINLLVILPAILVAVIFGGQIMGLYGRGFSEHTTALVFALSTAAVLGIQMPFGQVLAAAGLMWLEVTMNLAHAALFCLGTWWFLAEGATGLLGARFVAYLAHLVWSGAFVWWYLRKRESAAV